ncbi:MAG TPA: TRAP transporter large permease subunit [Gammaproteobacteria bacterium]
MYVLQQRSAWSDGAARAFDRLIVLMNGAGVVWVFALTFLICADIVGRTVFDHPIRGVTEIVSLSLVASVFLQVAYAVQQDRITRAEMLLGPLDAGAPSAARRWRMVMAAVGCVLLALTAVGEWPDTVRALLTSEFAGVQGQFTMLVWPIKAIIVLGSVVAALEYLRQVAAAQPAAPAASTRGARAIAWLTVIGPLAVAAAAAVVGLAGAEPAEPRTIGVLMIVAVLLLIGLGLPIAISLLLTGFVGLVLLERDFGVATRTLALAAEGTVSDYVFATVPLFVLMGLFVNVSDIGRDAFRAAQQIFGRIVGGLGVATVAANAIFAAITGISIASAAIFTKIAVPEMVRHGYTPKFAVGLTAGSSVLGMLIPPSLLLIIYGVIAEVSIGALFIAAVIPGILLAVAFAVAVMLMARLWPEFVGHVHRGGADGDAGGMRAFLGLLPVLFLILLVLGGIYGGVFTPTEAGAAGAFAAMCLALLRRRLTWAKLWEVIRETGQVSVIILFLIISASTFSRMLTLTELPQDMAGFLGGTGLGMSGFLAAYLVLLIVLGCVLDSTSIMLILLPLALPVVTALGGDLVWFGVITTIGVEIGLLTPPLGLSAYVIKSSLDDDRVSLGTIFAGSFPFVLIMTAVTILLMAVPKLSLVFLG